MSYILQYAGLSILLHKYKILNENIDLQFLIKHIYPLYSEC